MDDILVFKNSRHNTETFRFCHVGDVIPVGQSQMLALELCGTSFCDCGGVPLDQGGFEAVPVGNGRLFIGGPGASVFLTKKVANGDN
jgi:hypothetical protein